MNLFDIFVSHASEDKESLVRPLVKRLEEEHLHVWYDEFALKLGDSLRRSIDLGLARSRFGVVVLSHAFFAKQWPQRELDGLVARESLAGERVILPVWHGISKEEICQYSPTLADLMAVSSARGIEHVVREILRAVRPEGSPLIIARDRLIELGVQPAVVTDEWWLDVVEASNRECSWGLMPHRESWGHWAFPLPEGTTVYDRGERLARTAMQLAWVAAAETERISQIVPPDRVLGFIGAHPGLSDACHEYPHFLATYAPQLTMSGCGGEFEADFEALLQASVARYRKLHEEGSAFGSATTVTRLPPRCDEFIALRHPSFGDLQPSSVACQFVQGDVGGPPCRVYGIFDYAIWLLSHQSSWMPAQVRELLILGMKEWAVWLWTDAIPVDQRELGVRPYRGMGALAEGLSAKRPILRPKLGSPEREDLVRRARISKRLLSLPESAERLASRFLEHGFIQVYTASNRRRRMKTT